MWGGVVCTSRRAANEIWGDMGRCARGHLEEGGLDGVALGAEEEDVNGRVERAEDVAKVVPQVNGARRGLLVLFVEQQHLGRVVHVGRVVDDGVHVEEQQPQRERAHARHHQHKVDEVSRLRECLDHLLRQAALTAGREGRLCEKGASRHLVQLAELGVAREDADQLHLVHSS